MPDRPPNRRHAPRGGSPDRATVRGPVRGPVVARVPVASPGPATTATAADLGVVPFESCRIGQPGESVRESSEFLAGRGEVRQTLRRFARAAADAGIPYSVMGGLALNAHGYERVTTDIDVVVTDQARRRIHELLSGRGFLPPFDGSRNLRDTTNGVRIDLVLAGDFPGDGKPKPVAFPDPSSFEPVVLDGVRYVTLVQLVELKLASGMTNPARLRDLADVLATVGALRLPRTWGEQIHAWVRPKWFELWDTWDADPRKDGF